MKIREQIKDWKKYTCRTSDCWKNFKKKEKREKRTRKCGQKKKKNEKKTKTMDNTNTFYFYFSDFWVWDWRRLFVVLFCWNCIAEDFVAQFDVAGSGTIV